MLIFCNNPDCYNVDVTGCHLDITSEYSVKKKLCETTGSLWFYK